MYKGQQTIFVLAHESVDSERETTFDSEHSYSTDLIVELAGRLLVGVLLAVDSAAVDSAAPEVLLLVLQLRLASERLICCIRRHKSRSNSKSGSFCTISSPSS